MKKQKQARVEQIRLEGRLYYTGYKVVTPDLRSLGLRRNPNIITYPFQGWYSLPQNQVEESQNDWGGIWACRTLGDAKKLAKYMMQRHKRKTRVFKSLLGKILYHNSYRIKTNSIMLHQDITIR